MFACGLSYRRRLCRERKRVWRMMASVLEPPPPSSLRVKGSEVGVF
ncbi:hypothetical protein LINPERHAP1_LOCUS9283, partial [Linum perenne]